MWAQVSMCPKLDDGMCIKLEDEAFSALGHDIYDQDCAKALKPSPEEYLMMPVDDQTSVPSCSLFSLKSEPTKGYNTGAVIKTEEANHVSRIDWCKSVVLQHGKFALCYLYDVEWVAVARR